MPIRLTCPSCSATLSVKDEFAGRAVKCPKCGGVIPASQPAPASPPAPAPSAPAQPAPPKAAPGKAVPVKSAPPSESDSEKDEERDAPARSAKSGSKVTGKPVDRSQDEDADDRPRRKGADRDDEDRDDRRAKSKRDDRDEDDRPAKRRRRDDDLRARGKKREGGGGGGGGATIALIICGTLLLICLGIGGSIWYAVYRVKKGVEEFAETANFRVTQFAYDRLQVGATTRAQAEQILGGGKIASADDVEKAFPTDRETMNRWTPLAQRGRAVMWRNGDDFLFAAFHPGTDADSRLMMKEWHPKFGASLFTGVMSDTDFLQLYPKAPVDPNPPFNPNPPIKPPEAPKDEEPPAGQLTPVTAEELARAYKANQATADAKYKDKWLIVEGKIQDVTTGSANEGAGAKLEGVKTPKGLGNLPVWCFTRPSESNKVWNLTRGQTVKIVGKCTGGGTLQTYVGLRFCRVESSGDDPAISTSAGDMVADFVTDATAANTKYRDKEVMVTDAVLETINGDLANFTTGKKGDKIKLQVRFTGTPLKMLKELKPNQRYTFKARSGGLFGDTIANYDGYIVP
jgi:predicted Zn finger-like uncharacterized protein